MSGAFDLLNAEFIKFLILFVGFRFFSAYSISAKKLTHTPHKLLLCIFGPDVNRNSTLVEAVLKDFGNVQAWLVSHGSDIREECLGSKNNLNGGSVVVILQRR